MATDWDAMSGAERSLRAVNPTMASALYDPESMRDFKVRVDDLITKLTESPAGAGNVASDPVARAQFGGGGAAWVEASGLFTAYGTVIAELKKLSGLLADCLAGMGIAVVASKDGIETVDDDIRRKMIAINERTSEAKVAAERQAEQERRAKETGEQQPQPQPSETAGGDGNLQ
ncbi:hypothetical protein [Streptomyces sp. NPDC059909]|uniref:hypothetical protein n=1 Tax=Streptomyces sp. NPDC059909 TaxID=3346998 RepID=UPI00364C7995